MELVTVYQSQGMLGAQVVKAKLESAGMWISADIRRRILALAGESDASERR